MVIFLLKEKVLVSSFKRRPTPRNSTPVFELFLEVVEEAVVSCKCGMHLPL